MAFCTQCGATVPDGVKFCVECGKPFGETAQPVPAMASAPAHGGTVSQAPPPAFTPPQAAPQPPVIPQPPFGQSPQSPPPVQLAYGDNEPPKGSKYAVITMGSYILTMILFSLPLIGWLICLIMAFASTNLNRRNFAKATLVLIAIGLVLSIILYFVMGWVWQAVMESAQEYMGEAVGGLSDLGNVGDLYNLYKGPLLSVPTGS